MLAEYHRKMLEIQQAVSKRELHRLELEKELSRIRHRKEICFDKLKMKLKALKQELQSEEQLQGRKVELLLSRIEAQKNEVEAIEKRTKQLKRKKKDFEVRSSLLECSDFHQKSFEDVHPWRTSWRETSTQTNWGVDVTPYETEEKSNPRFIIPSRTVTIPADSDNHLIFKHSSLLNLPKPATATPTDNILSTTLNIPPPAEMASEIDLAAIQNYYKEYLHLDSQQKPLLPLNNSQNIPQIPEGTTLEALQNISNKERVVSKDEYSLANVGEPLQSRVPLISDLSRKETLLYNGSDKNIYHNGLFIRPEELNQQLHLSQYDENKGKTKGILKISHIPENVPISSTDKTIQNNDFVSYEAGDESIYQTTSTDTNVISNDKGDKLNGISTIKPNLTSPLTDNNQPDSQGHHSENSRSRSSSIKHLKLASFRPSENDDLRTEEKDIETKTPLNSASVEHELAAIDKIDDNSLSSKENESSKMEVKEEEPRKTELREDNDSHSPVNHVTSESGPHSNQNILKNETKTKLNQQSKEIIQPTEPETLQNPIKTTNDILKTTKVENKNENVEQEMETKHPKKPDARESLLKTNETPILQTIPSQTEQSKPQNKKDYFKEYNPSQSTDAYKRMLGMIHSESDPHLDADDVNSKDSKITDSTFKGTTAPSDVLNYDTESIDSVEAAIQAATLGKAANTKPGMTMDASPTTRPSEKSTEKLSSSAPPPTTVLATDAPSLSNKPKVSSALLKPRAGGNDPLKISLDSESESLSVSGAQLSDDDDFDFYD